MTHLRQLMLEELHRRNYAESTIRAYIRTLQRFSRYFRRPPDVDKTGVAFDGAGY